MFFLLKLVPFFLSLIIISFVSLFFITIGNIVTSYIYKFLGDSTACDEGFDSFDPFKSIDFLFFIFLLISGWFIGLRRPPFLYIWKTGIKGVLQKIIYFLLPSIFHLVISSLTLFLGTFIFSIKFFILTLGVCSLRINGSYLERVSDSLGIKGPWLIIATVFIYTITVNLNLALIDFFFSLIDFIVKKYFYNDFLDPIFLVLIALLFILVMYFFGGHIMYFLWMLISYPLIFFL